MMSYVQPYLEHTLLGKLTSPSPLESKKIVSGSVSSSVSLWGSLTGLLSNQGEKSINFYFIRVPLKKSIKVWYSKAQF